MKSASIANISLPVGWTAAAVVSLVLFVGIAFALAIWQPTLSACMTTDPAGNFYAVHGNRLIRWDSKGARTLEIDLTRPPTEIKDASDIAIDSNGDILIADKHLWVVVRISPSGQALETIEAPREPADWWGRAKPPISVVASNGSVWVLSFGTVERTDRTGTTETVYDDESSLWASDLAVGADGTLVMSDPGNGRLITVNPSGERSLINCLELEGDFRCPDAVEIAEDGSIVTVLRKPWQRLGDFKNPGVPLGTRGEPATWMGEVYRIPPGEDGLQRMPIAVNGRPLSVFDLGLLPGKRMSMMALNIEGFYTWDLSSGQVARFSQGDLGVTMDKADREGRLRAAGPQVFGLLGLICAVIFGVLGATIAVRDTQSPLGNAALVPAPIQPGTGLAIDLMPATSVSGEGVPAGRRLLIGLVVSTVPAIAFTVHAIWSWTSLTALRPIVPYMMASVWILPVCLALGLVWLWNKSSIYLFSDEGLSMNGRLVLDDWSSVGAVSFSRAGLMGSDGIVLSRLGPFGAIDVRLDVADLGPRSTEMSIREIIARVSPAAIDPTVLVLREYSAGIGAVAAQGIGDPLPTARLGRLGIRDSLRLLKKLALRNDRFGLLLGQALLLIGRPKQAIPLLETAARRSANEETLLCLAVCELATGQSSLATHSLAGVANDTDLGIIRAAVARAPRSAASLRPRMRRITLMGWVSVAVVVAIMAVQIIVSVIR